MPATLSLTQPHTWSPAMSSEPCGHEFAYPIFCFSLGYKFFYWSRRITAKVYQVHQIVLYFLRQKKFLGQVLLGVKFPCSVCGRPASPSLSTTTIRPYMKPSFCLYVLWQCLQHCPLHSHTHGLQPCSPSRVGMKVLTLFFVSIRVIYFSCYLSSDFSVELPNA